MEEYSGPVLAIFDTPLCPKLHLISEVFCISVEHTLIIDSGNFFFLFFSLMVISNRFGLWGVLLEALLGPLSWPTVFYRSPYGVGSLDVPF